MHVLFVTLLGLTLCAGLYALPSVARGEDVNYVSKSPSKSFFDSLDEHFADMEDKIRAADRKMTRMMSESAIWERLSERLDRELDRFEKITSHRLYDEAKAPDGGYSVKGGVVRNGGSRLIAVITGEKEDSNSDSGTDAADTGRINDWGDHLDSTDHSSFDDGEVERDETTY